MSDVTGRPTVAAVIGSPHRGGNTVALADAALAELESLGCACTRIFLADMRIAPCEGHEDCAQLAACVHDDDMDGVLEQVYAADALILATPVYYENVTAQMKLFIDRNATRYYHDEWLTPTVVGLIAVATESGLDETLEALRRFVALSTKEAPPIVSLRGFAEKPGDAVRDAGLMAEARAFGRSIGRELGLA
jgi:multimeric flavodoxin WrbA